MPEIHLSHLTKAYTPGIVALDDVELTIRDGERFVLVGPSGCGKSTTLRLLAGLERPDRGEIFFDGMNVTDAPAAKRHVGMVLQSDNLFPHLNVNENLALGLRMRRIAPESVAQRIADMVNRLELDAWLDRWPHELSGGEQQRVALGRALVGQTAVCLLDEPLSHMDASLRHELRLTIRSLHEDLGTTILYVTHDQVEAMTLGQRIAVMREGRILQVGTPREVYESPANAFVGRFFGTPAMNLFQARVLNGQLNWLGHAVRLQRAVDDGPVIVGARPEHFRVGSDEPLEIPCTVDAVEYLGAEQIVHVTHSNQRFAVRVVDVGPLGAGTRLLVSCAPNHFHLFHPESPGLRIGCVDPES